ncbi:hypothetical protein M0804_002260 [Polistes exclamans]|nr:hypothetical protein M0804_002260 [Polistes exclamans]
MITHREIMRVITIALTDRVPRLTFVCISRIVTLTQRQQQQQQQQLNITNTTIFKSLSSIKKEQPPVRFQLASQLASQLAGLVWSGLLVTPPQTPPTLTPPPPPPPDLV